MSSDGSKEIGDAGHSVERLPSMDCPAAEDTTDSWCPPTSILQNCNGKDANGGNGLYVKESNGTVVLQNGHAPTSRKCCCCNQKAEHELLPNTTVPHSLCEGAADQKARRSDNVCGIWTFRPRWLQKFANKKAFLAVFCLTSVLQGMYYTYFVSVLTTIEKLYQIQSKTTGIIMSATEIGQIGGALLLTYYGGQGHRPRWIACGMLVFALASILCSTPHFLFGGEILLPSASSGGFPPGTLNYTYQEMNKKLCRDAEDSRTYSLLFSLQTPAGVNDSVQWDPSPVMPDQLRSRNAACDSPEITSQQTRITHMVLAVFFVSLLFIGIGATAVYTLGIPYIDDNVANRESPLYFGITIGVRIFGPVFGFLLGSLCTGVYVNLFETPGVTTDDPQWIGAWWLGVFIVGAALILTSVPMMAFPKKLPSQLALECRSTNAALLCSEKVPQSNGHFHSQQCCHQHLQQGHACSQHSQIALLHDREAPKKPSLKDFPAAVRRLLKNEILLCRTASSVLHILPIAGLYTFLPKYLESQFQLTATRANMIVGMAGILVMGVGIFASGMFMRKFKPNARFVANWIAFCALAYSIGMVILMWLGCPLNNYVGLDNGAVGQQNSGLLCNTTCSCPMGEFAPICTSEGDIYLSPCRAGCSKVLRGETKDKLVYGDCACLNPGVTAVNGYCTLECNNLVWYTIIFSVFVLIHSTSEVGSMLLTLRCVDPQDKAMALGLISFAIGLFGNVPCPIIYGAVVDSACLFWEDNCGEPGACRVYDPVRFRMVFHGVTALIMLGAFVVDVVIWYKSSNIQFQDDEDAEREEVVPINEALCCAQTETSV